MAQLPTEQAIGDLPDHLPRRMGVGGWQPGDLARGAQELARGGQQLGLDLGMLAGQEQSQDDQVAMAKANSLAAVGHVKIAQDLANETDPEKAALYPDKFQQNVDSAAEAAGLRPDMAAKFKINQAPEVARYQVGADTYTKGLLKNRAVAGFDTDADTAINTAIGTDDPTARQNILQGINGNLAGLVTKGYLTPEEARAKGQDLAHQYSTAHTAKLIGDAEGHYDQATGRWVPGDTSKLHEALEQFKFGPEAPGWNATVPGVPQDGASGEIDSPALRVKSYAPDLSAAAKQYGVSEDYLAKTAYIESQGNATADKYPNARNPFHSME